VASCPPLCPIHPDPQPGRALPFFSGRDRQAAGIPDTSATRAAASNRADRSLEKGRRAAHAGGASRQARRRAFPPRVRRRNALTIEYQAPSEISDLKFEI